ncbi:aldose 1-epimerase family protein [Lysinibacter sp. HNR]|uniref:aldose 1-epimerase family protein n=1 Tax=Lysinibacter sp. HNR TaxID=3031408 RepID=UPI00243579A7|nr:aldose 1-epimerase family protein [Lysinibacter sp. HNR]WGD37729.1 aldose 1-epimerase family protein [Lysinibacter sp. HNR]
MPASSSASTSSPVSVSGHNITISGGDYTATIASIGATLRSLQYLRKTVSSQHGTELRHDSSPHENLPPDNSAGRDLIVPFAADEVRPAYRGALLAPWPNRVIDGAYAFNGQTQQLALTEPARRHALHGLAAWLDFTVVDQSHSSVTLEAEIVAQTGYPHRVKVRATYTVDTAGLHTTVVGTNLGDTEAPWGLGAHPYLIAGSGRLDEWELTLPASRILTVVGERLIPAGVEEVSSAREGYFDFRHSRNIGSTQIDHAFTELARDSHAHTTVVARAPQGTGVRLILGQECPWVHIYTSDRPGTPADRIGLAVEPMTCPPDAYNSGTNLIVLQPGESAPASWTIDALEANF